MGRPMVLHNMEHERDPKEELLEKLGKTPDFINLFGARVLVAVYLRPQKTKGGIFLTDKVNDEDIYQGRVGLVIKMGPLAFKPTKEVPFPVFAEIGDWVTFSPQDGKGTSVNGVYCRILEDVYIDGSIGHPDVIF